MDLQAIHYMLYVRNEYIMDAVSVSRTWHTTMTIIRGKVVELCKIDGVNENTP